jgi:lysozyme
MALCVLAACGGPGDPYGTSEEALCPSGTTVNGVDVSVYQGSVNWTSVKNAGKVFAFARISDGSYLDTEFSTNWPAMKAAGLVRGAYQFFEPGEDPTTQANIVISAVGTLVAGDLPVVADMEVTGGQSAATIVANLQTWMAKVKTGTGKTPMVYTAEGFWNGSVGGSSAFSSNPLWVANWGVTCPTLPSGWSSFQFWQSADNGSVSGISGSVDLDEFNGSLEQLQAFAGMAPAYAAQYVSQTWAFATSTIPMTAGQVMKASIVLKNVGTATWDSNTKLGTTVPRDRASPFADATWLAPNRLVAVSGTVPPGGTYSFDFEWTAPGDGMYDEHYDLVQEGVAWFGDPGQGGPPDSDIEAKFDVTGTAPTPDAGSPVHDAGTTYHDAGSTDHDAGSTDHDAGSTDHDAGPTDHDAGPAHTDAGEATRDAGASGKDAGEQGDAAIALVDAGPQDTSDAGQADAAEMASGGGDGGASESGSNESDGGSESHNEHGGCACDSTSASAAPLLALLVLGGRRRRLRTA